MSIKFKITNYCNEDYIEFPPYTICEISRDELNHLKDIAQMVQNNNLKCAVGNFSFFEKSPVLYDDDICIEENLESDISIEDNRIIIKPSTFRIECDMGDVNCSCFSEDIDYNEIENLIKVSELPIEHMAKYVYHENENIRNIAKERLENKSNN